MKPTRLLGLFGSLLFIYSCATSSTRYEQIPSANFNERVQFLVMHFTAIDYEESVHALVDPDGLSSHYLIPENSDPSYAQDDIEVIQLVDETQRAWHAGNSYWQGRRMLNDVSIGIEIVNVPECFKAEAHQSSVSPPIGEHDPQRLCLFPDFDPEQIQLLIELSRDILARNPDIVPTQVVGHSDIAPTRKNDPGPRFPWFELYKAGIGAWYENETVNRYWQQFSTVPPPLALLQKAFRAYGYDVDSTGKMDTETTSVISAFQMHFLSHKVTGVADPQTAAVLFALIERYLPEQSKLLNEHYRTYLLQTSTIKNVAVQPTKQAQFHWTPLSVTSKGNFRSYQGKGSLVVENHNADEVTVAINGETLNLTTPMTHHSLYEYSLSRRTVDGLNRIEILDVEPDNSSLRVHIPYTTLSKQTTKEASPFELIWKQIKPGLDGTDTNSALSIIHKGKIQYERLSEDISDSYLFSGNGLTENLMLNFAAMKLLSEGKLHLSDAVFKYVPAFKGQGREQITISDVLGHTAGLPADRQTNLHPLMPLSSVPFSPNLDKVPVYSTYHYALLREVIESVSNETFDVYVLKELFIPLGLAINYTQGISLNIMQILAQSLLNHGGYGQTTLFDDYVLSDLTAPQRNAREWGYGWQRANFGQFASQSSYGLISKNGSFLFIDPEYDLAIIYFKESADESYVMPIVIIEATYQALFANK